jgi:hypothetical protein
MEDDMRAIVTLFLVVFVLGCATEAVENAPAAQAVDSGRMSGTVLETIDAANYTYVRFETPDGEKWAAVPKARVEVGAQVTIVNSQPMANFESKTLQRRFDTIYFGTLENTVASGHAPAAGANPHASMGQESGANAEQINVARAEGASGRTVAELYAESADLSGKTVTLRGKVVKYNAGIMGRNWIHLQDGSGSAAAGTSDITITSDATAAVGDIVLISGTVTLDKDFGSGYRYAVLVEDATVE